METRSKRKGFAWTFLQAKRDLVNEKNENRKFVQEWGSQKEIEALIMACMEQAIKTNIVKAGFIKASWMANVEGVDKQEKQF